MENKENPSHIVDGLTKYGGLFLALIGGLLTLVAIRFNIYEIQLIGWSCIITTFFWWLILLLNISNVKSAQTALDKEKEVFLEKIEKTNEMNNIFGRLPIRTHLLEHYGQLQDIILIGREHSGIPKHVIEWWVSIGPLIYNIFSSRDYYQSQEAIRCLSTFIQYSQKVLPAEKARKLKLWAEELSAIVKSDARYSEFWRVRIAEN